MTLPTTNYKTISDARVHKYSNSTDR